ncbi:hypothetical protein CEXT_13911 [Caerostris extrusa]|uniref:Uncharacterized protein n=1 Tax=Caerostris extrusa TaxID=172846 RepID=A0AAV4SMU5_CAEEX|nr:hypothetical protein CEXT_13911 [Caerostris extrusa]
MRSRTSQVMGQRHHAEGIPDEVVNEITTDRRGAQCNSFVLADLLSAHDEWICNLGVCFCAERVFYI